MSIFPLEHTPPPARPSRRRLPVIVALAIGLLVLGLAAVLPGLIDDDGEAASPPGSATTGSPQPSASPEPPATLDAVKRFQRLGTGHTSGPVTYRTAPPVGGPHAEEWIDCGVHDVPLPDEFAVHSLEHGTVWITHRPELEASAVRKLAALLPRGRGILSPYPGQRGAVVVTVWGAQLRLKNAADPRLPLFLQRYGDGHTAPEPSGSCAGGLTPRQAVNRG